MAWEKDMTLSSYRYISSGTYGYGVDIWGGPSVHHIYTVRGNLKLTGKIYVKVDQYYHFAKSIKETTFPMLWIGISSILKFNGLSLFKCNAVFDIFRLVNVRNSLIAAKQVSDYFSCSVRYIFSDRKRSYLVDQFRLIHHDIATPVLLIPYHCR